MPSTINTAAIDTTFPVPGADNDTQGFRDNFASIVTALTTASSEISNLQANSANLIANNNFNSNQIQNAVLRDVGWLSQVSNAAVVGARNVNYLAGAYAVYSIDPSVPATLSVIGWPTNGVSWTSMRIQVATSSQSLPASLTFAPRVGKTQYVDSNLTLPRTLAAGKIYIFEVSSPNGGETTFVREVGNYV